METMPASDRSIPAEAAIRAPWDNLGYTRRFATMHYRRFEGRGACSLGIGPCRERGTEDPHAIVSAIAGGCNVLDTAFHHHHGAHERCIGEAVRLASEQQLCRREDLVVTTTIGIVPDLVEHTIASLGFARLTALLEDRFVERGIFGWGDLVQGMYCIAPELLRESVEHSLARTGLGYFDCVFLDSLELHRMYVGTRELSRRFTAAAEMLEQLRARGLLRCWGISAAYPIDLDELLGLLPTDSQPRALRVPFSMLRAHMRPMIRRAAAAGMYVVAAGALDGGVPQYSFPEELDRHIGDRSDAAAAIAWVQSFPGVGTALFGSRDARHVRENLRAAAAPLLGAELYAEEDGAPAT